MSEQSPVPVERKAGTRPTRRLLKVSVGLAIIVVILTASFLTPLWRAHERNQQLENLRSNARFVTMTAMAVMLDKRVDTVTYNDLIKLNYILPVPSVYGEDYSKLVLSSKQDWVELVGRDGRQFWFHVDWNGAYPPPVSGPFSSPSSDSMIKSG